MGRSSERVILVCEHCGERLVLGEPEEVWLSTRTLFECECGRDVSLASRLEETTRAENYKTQK
jgi:predicted SprT family Zn-dependent metalloprotease